MFMSKLTSKVLADSNAPVVNTKYGKLCGLLKEDGYIFRGIKYADASRFHMPIEVQSWEGVKDAVHYGCVCPELTTPIPPDQHLNPHYFMPQDENCQYLNIWTRALDRNAKKPVMVWIHGGAWSTGSGVELFAYDGENLADYGDVVVVSLNHRINCLGYLDLSSLAEEYKNSGSVGLEDIVMALKWVKENILAFGGNPDNVMLFGQSGGVAKIFSLMQSSTADGLYHKVAVDSGGMKFMCAPKGWTNKKLAQHLGELTASELGLTKDNINNIETIPYWYLAEAVMTAIKKLKAEIGVDYRWEPSLDGDNALVSPVIAGFRSETQHIPMMIGSVFGEARSNSNVKIGDGNKNDWDEETKIRYINEMYGENAESMIEAFQEAYPDKNLADVLFIDNLNRYGLAELSLKRAKTGSKVWNWLFTLESPINCGTVAWHCSELPYIFHNADYIEAAFIPGISNQLQDIMATAWISFAKNSDPNCDGMPNWEPVNPCNLPTMVFDTEVSLRVNFDKKLQEILQKAKIN